MPREFYTEKDIEDLAKRGILSLEVNDNIVLTELAYEKAGRLGVKLLRDKPDNPPCAPVRPYLSEKKCRCAGAPSVGAAQTAGPCHESAPPASPQAATDLERRIRDAVLARVGSDADPGLLDVIIKRVLAATASKG